MLAKDLLSLFSYQYQKLLSMIDLQIIYSFVFLESYPRGHAQVNVNDKTAKKKKKKKELALTY